jgi:hypothetical protein
MWWFKSVIQLWRAGKEEFCALWMILGKKVRPYLKINPKQKGQECGSSESVCLASMAKLSTTKKGKELST